MFRCKSANFVCEPSDRERTHQIRGGMAPQPFNCTLQKTPCFFSHSGRKSFASLSMFCSYSPSRRRRLPSGEQRDLACAKPPPPPHESPSRKRLSGEQRRAPSAVLGLLSSAATSLQSISATPLFLLYMVTPSSCRSVYGCRAAKHLAAAPARIRRACSPGAAAPVR